MNPGSVCEKYSSVTQLKNRQETLGHGVPLSSGQQIDNSSWCGFRPPAEIALASHLPRWNPNTELKGADMYAKDLSSVRAGAEGLRPRIIGGRRTTEARLRGAYGLFTQENDFSTCPW